MSNELIPLDSNIVSAHGAIMPTQGRVFSYEHPIEYYVEEFGQYVGEKEAKEFFAKKKLHDNLIKNLDHKDKEKIKKI